jgi:hypothetical protein
MQRRHSTAREWSGRDSEPVPETDALRNPRRILSRRGINATPRTIADGRGSFDQAAARGARTGDPASSLELRIDTLVAAGPSETDASGQPRREGGDHSSSIEAAVRCQERFERPSRVHGMLDAIAQFPRQCQTASRVLTRNWRLTSVIIVGALLGVAVVRVLASQVESVDTSDTWVALVVVGSFGVLIAISTLLACRSAAGVNPAVSMRAD